jgi:hypothetical protein
MYQGKILDGRNRFRACMKAGKPCQLRDYEGEDPLAYVVSVTGAWRKPAVLAYWRRG